MQSGNLNKTTEKSAESIGSVSSQWFLNYFPTVNCLNLRTTIIIYIFGFWSIFVLMKRESYNHELNNSLSYQRQQTKFPTHNPYCQWLLPHARHSIRGCLDSPRWNLSLSAPSPDSYNLSELQQQQWRQCLRSTQWNPYPVLKNS